MGQTSYSQVRSSVETVDEWGRGVSPDRDGVDMDQTEDEDGGLREGSLASHGGCRTV